MVVAVNTLEALKVVYKVFSFEKKMRKINKIHYNEALCSKMDEKL